MPQTHAMTTSNTDQLSVPDIRVVVVDPSLPGSINILMGDSVFRPRKEVTRQIGQCQRCNMFSHLARDSKSTHTQRIHAPEERITQRAGP